jgi:hypothetical protein
MVMGTGASSLRCGSEVKSVALGSRAMLVTRANSPSPGRGDN